MSWQESNGLDRRYRSNTSLCDNRESKSRSTSQNQRKRKFVIPLLSQVAGDNWAGRISIFWADWSSRKCHLSMFSVLLNAIAQWHRHLAWVKRKHLAACRSYDSTLLNIKPGALDPWRRNCSDVGYYNALLYGDVDDIKRNLGGLRN